MRAISSCIKTSKQKLKIIQNTAYIPLPKSLQTSLSDFKTIWERVCYETHAEAPHYVLKDRKKYTADTQIL